MDQYLEQIRNLLQTHQVLANYQAYKDGAQIHLTCAWGDFARLRPDAQSNSWKMDFFLHRDRWRRFEFTGTIEECLELLREAPHYLFWEG
jgi:hypothetical protein